MPTCRLAALPLRLLAALAMLVAGLAGAAAADDGPDAVAKAFYAGYSKRLDGDYEGLDAYRRAALTPDLAKKIAAIDAAAEKAGDAGLDFDYVINGQDSQALTKIAAKTVSQTGDAAKVKVSFVMFGPTTITLTMKKLGGRWKIDDFDYGADQETLRETLAILAKEYQ